jgi:hypothetical protein
MTPFQREKQSNHQEEWIKDSTTMKLIRSRKQKTDIGRYSFVNRTIQVWNQLPAYVLGNFYCKPSKFRKGVRKVMKKEELRGGGGEHRSE